MRINKFALSAASFALAAFLTPQPAHAVRCVVVSATASAGSKADAVVESRKVLDDKVASLKAQYGWRSASVAAQRVKGDTFWKAVRPEVPREAMLPPDVVNARAHSTCWTGVVVPYVCTSGARVCGN